MFDNKLTQGFVDKFITAVPSDVATFKEADQILILEKGRIVERGTHEEAYGQILRQPVLDLPRYGCINVHASILPRWRGASPIQAAIAARRYLQMFIKRKPTVVILIFLTLF